MTAPIVVPTELVATSSSVRRLDLAATSGCDRIRVLVHENVDIARLATDVYNLEQEGMSAAALVTGNQQEASLLRAGAAPLIELLSDAGRLRPGELGFLDIRKLPTRRQARETVRLLDARLAGESLDVHVLAQPTFEVDIWGHRHRFRADFAVLPGAGEPSLGEKKSFHDFNADTDQPAMRALFDQGGAYYALADLALRQSGAAARADLFQPVLDAVLRGPRIYRLTVADERDRTLRLLSADVAADLDDAAADAAHAAGTNTVGPGLVEALSPNRGSHCKACPLRNLCRDEAYTSGDVTILSTRTRTVAAGAGTAFRAAAVVAGAAAPAAHEQSLAADADALRAELHAAGWTSRRFTA